MPRNKSTQTKRKRTRRTVSKNTQAIAKLARQLHTKRQYQKTFTTTATGVSLVQRLVTPDNWTECFATYADVGMTSVGTSMTIRNAKLKWLCQPENTEADTADSFFQIFVVSLKPMHARTIRKGGYATLQAGYHYDRVALDSVGGALDGYGLFMLNPMLYNVHYHSGVRRQGTITQTGTEVTNLGDITHLGGKNLKWDKTLVCKDAQPGGFQHYPADEVPDGKQLYFMMLSNASVASPLFVSCNTIFDVTSHRGL